MLNNLNKSTFGSLILGVLTLALVAGCDNGAQQVATNKNQDNQSIPGQAQVDTLSPRYTSTLSSGIEFDRDGYPDFVSGVQGISRYETFGRWTDGTQAQIDFNKNLPKKFTLKIRAGTFAPWENKPIQMEIGATHLEAKFSSEKPTDFTIAVETDGNAKSIVFKFPGAQSPKELGFSDDARKLALSLIRIQIIE